MQRLLTRFQSGPMRSALPFSSWDGAGTNRAYFPVQMYEGSSISSYNTDIVTQSAINYAFTPADRLFSTRPNLIASAALWNVKTWRIVASYNGGADGDTFPVSIDETVNAGGSLSVTVEDGIETDRTEDTAASYKRGDEDCDIFFFYRTTVDGVSSDVRVDLGARGVRVNNMLREDPADRENIFALDELSIIIIAEGLNDIARTGAQADLTGDFEAVPFTYLGTDLIGNYDDNTRSASLEITAETLFDSDDWE